MANQLLAGLTVLDLSDFYSGPLSARLLADLGAEVIKIEPPTGDSSRRRGPFPGDQPDSEQSGLFWYMNAGKQSMTLDWRTATGKQILLQLVDHADVLVENLPVGALAEGGLGYEVLHERNPRLVVTSISPFGQDSPLSHWKAFDINVSAFGGMTTAIGSPDREPLTPPQYQAEYQGAIEGAVGTVMACLLRMATGRGQHVDLSTAEGLATLHMGSNMVSYVFSGRVRLRGGHRTRAVYPNSILPCKDGEVAIHALQGREWQRIVHMVGDPEWASQPRYRDRVRMGEDYPDEVDALLAPWLMARTKQEIFAAAREHRVPVAPVQSVDEVSRDEHLRARGLFQQLDGPNGGSVEVPGFPAIIDGERPRLGPAPSLGQHTMDILADRLGYPKDDILLMYQTGII